MAHTDRQRLRNGGGVRRLVAILMVWSVAAAGSEAPDLIPADAPPPAVNWDAPFDFSVLRNNYGRRMDFSDRCSHRENAERASQALVNGDFQEVISLTEPLLTECPVDPSFHLWRAAALQAAGRKEEAETHKRWYLGLMQSVLESGDGSSADTAYVTISTGEEYATLTYLGLTPRRQAVLQGSPPVDVVSVVDDAGKPSTVYFTPALQFLRVMESLRQSAQ